MGKDNIMAKPRPRMPAKMQEAHKDGKKKGNKIPSHAPPLKSKAPPAAPHKSSGAAPKSPVESVGDDDSSHHSGSDEVWPSHDEKPMDEEPMDEEPMATADTHDTHMDDHEKDGLYTFTPDTSIKLHTETDDQGQEWELLTPRYLGACHLNNE